MKIIFTILFFVDSILLFVLAYLFFKFADAGMNGFTFGLLVAAMLCCIWLLVYFLVRYIKLPDSNNNN